MKEYAQHPMCALMDRVLEIRYTDLEEERTLTLQLLDWSQTHDDTYAAAFAHVYLGDYYVAQYDSARSGPHLLQGKTLAETHNYAQLRLRAYSLLGLYYELLADEQTSIQYYLDAIAVAHQLGDGYGESLVLNNLAFALRRHNCFQEALAYYQQAYALQAPLAHKPQVLLLLSNLVDVATEMGEAELALHYIQLSQGLEDSPTQKAIYDAVNWICYYTCRKDIPRTLHWVEKVLALESEINVDRLTAFETYSVLSLNMLHLNHQAYAKRFLTLMEQVSAESGVDQLQVLEERHMAYILQFEPPHTHPAAYARYYHKTQEYTNRNNQTIANGMKAKVQLNQALLQKESLRTQQKNLEQEVNQDSLTGLRNRRALYQLMERLLGATQWHRLGAIMLDVDYFKEYNDLYGHLEGDSVLQAVGRCLLNHSSEEFQFFRFGGDEFIGICLGQSDQAVLTLVEAIQTDFAQLNRPHAASPRANRVTLSIGYANESAAQGARPYLMVELADQALYQSKLTGRNCHTRKEASQL